MNGYIDHYYVGEGGEDEYGDFMDDSDEAYHRSVDEAIRREYERVQRRLRLERRKENE
jgi:hypothetical protein